MNKSREATYRFGTTGTLDGTQTHKLVLEGLFGKIYNVTTTKKLQDDETLAALDIKVMLLKYPDEVRRAFGKKQYHDEIDYIVTNEARNNLIKNLAIDQEGNTLVLFQLVDKHGKVLFDLIREAAHERRKVFFVSGETETSDREAIRKIVEKQKNSIIVASLGTFSTGINIRNLHNIVFLLLLVNPKLKCCNLSVEDSDNRMMVEQQHYMISLMTYIGKQEKTIL